MVKKKKPWQWDTLAAFKEKYGLDGSSKTTKELYFIIAKVIFLCVYLIENSTTIWSLKSV